MILLVKWFVRIMHMIRYNESRRKWANAPFKKTIQYFAQFSKLIREMFLFWNSIFSLFFWNSIFSKLSYKKKKLWSPIVEFFNSISLKSSYMQFFFFFLPITQLYEDRVKKCHYRSLKRHYRLLKNVIIWLNSILRKSSFKRGVFP